MGGGKKKKKIHNFIRPSERLVENLF